MANHKPYLVDDEASAKLIAELRATVDTSGGGGDDGKMEARVAKLENAVEYIQRDVKELRDDVRKVRDEISGIRTTDFRITFAAIIAVALGLSGLMAKGFHWI